MCTALSSHALKKWNAGNGNPTNLIQLSEICWQFEMKLKCSNNQKQRKYLHKMPDYESVFLNSEDILLHLCEWDPSKTRLFTILAPDWWNEPPRQRLCISSIANWKPIYFHCTLPIQFSFEEFIWPLSDSPALTMVQLAWGEYICTFLVVRTCFFMLFALIVSHFG